jgi:ABC-2 type transport system permease protein
MNGARLYLRYLGISLRSQMQYRASFIMVAMGACLAHFTEFIGIWALFTRFGTLRGWGLAEVGLFYGLINVAMNTGEAVARGFDLFPSMVKNGDFDRLLLRPRHTALQVGAQELQLARIGPMVQGLVVLLWAVSVLEIEWTIARIGLMLFTVLGGACLFAGLFVIQATLAFWTTETLELMNTMTYGGRETAQYPLNIYRPWFRKFFTFVVPLACVSYYPILVILGRVDTASGCPPWFGWIAPIIGLLFLIISLQFWQFGVRHYRSTGS